jgi:WD40 repeat protein
MIDERRAEEIMSQLQCYGLPAIVLILISWQPLRPDEPAAQTDALPAGAVSRLGTSRFLNFGRVFSVAFSPDGKTLAAGSWDGTVRLWEVATGKELHQFHDQKTRVRAVAFSPDGETLACTGEGSVIVLRDTATGKELRRLAGHRGPIAFVAFSPDGRLLASKAYDQTLRLWDVAGGREVRRLSSQDSPKQVNDVECPIAFAPDGKTVISGTLAEGAFGIRPQRTFRVWNMATGAEVRSFKDDSPSLGNVAFSPDNRLLAVANGSTRGLPPRIRLWDVASSRALRPIEPAPDVHPASFSLAFSPDGKTLASSGGGPIQLWEVATRRGVCCFPTHDAGPAHLAFSPASRLLASGSTDITVLLWDVTGRMQNGDLQPATLSPEQFQSLWGDLADQDGSKARRALWTLVSADGASAALLRGRLHPAASPASAEAIARLVADLDSAEYTVRTKAKAQLAQLGEFAEPALLEAEKHQPSLELRHRIEELSKQIIDVRSRPSGDRLRELRAVEILEQIATPEAQQVLQTLARGAASALLTREAQASLMRLERHARGPGQRRGTADEGRE